MSGDRTDEVMLIGLHRVSADSPASLTEKPMSEIGSNETIHDVVTLFPIHNARRPAVLEMPIGLQATDGRNVIAFRPRPGKTSGHSRKA